MNTPLQNLCRERDHPVLPRSTLTFRDDQLQTAGFECVSRIHVQSLQADLSSARFPNQNQTKHWYVSPLTYSVPI